ncbi:two-component system, chemotaxis family, response regulator CheY [Terribacillus halophilus]|uniref:Two-component system, chemotaxis family, response regulator CheY n=1 Tax=Terribacillus halophilus TaxID=361279 RepID=A0A1G6MVE8_9BACI|nr:two-component system, chemotaxis family, response regulator CheY [Terribacillus halophilus]
MAKILIVDDAKFMRKTLRGLLTENSHEIVGEAADGYEAVSQFRDTHPDIVFMDITMPHMDGLAALKEIIGIDPEAKVIMCSAMGQQRIVMQAIELGAKDFITKPFEDARVIETVERILA